MELALRILAVLVAALGLALNMLASWTWTRRRPTFAPIRDRLLTLSMTDVLRELRTKKITSEKLVLAYIARIKDVNAVVNAVVEDRFEKALEEARYADELIARASTGEQSLVLFGRYPLLGVPCTVKESCGVKGMSFAVGSVYRTRKRSPDNGDVVQLLRAAGAIPLLVSANPEFCLSFNTSSHVNGRCLNPYDLHRTMAGSSGGEATLNGAGATLFGIGSDIAGSIRLPSLFGGIFGLKPSGGLLSIRGHFPNSDTDAHLADYLQIGLMTRFARDLPLLLHIAAGTKAEQLHLGDNIPTKDIKVYYAYGFDGINGLCHPSTGPDIRAAINAAVECLQKGGLRIHKFDAGRLRNSLEISICALANLGGIPSIVTQSARIRPTSKTLFFELLRSVIGHSLHTTDALLLELLQRFNGLIAKKRAEEYLQEAKILRQELTSLLGDNGVIFFPTFYASNICSNSVISNILGIDMMLLFNVLGLPALHVPMGVSEAGNPVGFQVIAAPLQDKLCVQIAAELEIAFGGWQPPLPHAC